MANESPEPTLVEQEFNQEHPPVTQFDVRRLWDRYRGRRA